jgi:two-component system OmpR family response regulator
LATFLTSATRPNTFRPNDNLDGSIADARGTSARSARVLVVDDDATMRRMVVNYLCDHDLSASAVGGRAALFEQFGRREPDLVLLDLHLGQDDGLDLLREIKSRSDLPVIIITGRRRDESDRVVGLELGADDYVTKPFSLRELLV